MIVNNFANDLQSQNFKHYPTDNPRAAPKSPSFRMLSHKKGVPFEKRTPHGRVIGINLSYAASNYL